MESSERLNRNNTLYGMGSTLPCGHKIDYSMPKSPYLRRRIHLNGIFFCPECKKEFKLPCDYNLNVLNPPLQKNSEECVWVAPDVTKFFKDEPTKEEKKKHKDIKENNLTAIQRKTTETLEVVMKKAGADFVLCDEKDAEEDFTDVLEFLISDYAQQGEEPFRERRNRALPVLKLCKADFDPELDITFENNKDGSIQPRGQFIYHQPTCDWLRVGLNVKGKYENDKWMQETGKDTDWVIAYHGSRTIEGGKSIAENQSVETGGVRQLHQNDLDVNPLSTRYNKTCGPGAYFACDIGVASGYAVEEKKEKCVFEVRLNPTEMRIPKGERGYAIVNDSKNARPLGIWIKKDVGPTEGCSLM